MIMIINVCFVCMCIEYIAYIFLFFFYMEDNIASSSLLNVCVVFIIDGNTQIENELCNWMPFIEFLSFAMESKRSKNYLLVVLRKNKMLNKICVIKLTFSYFFSFVGNFLHDLFYIYRLLSINIPFVPNISIGFLLTFHNFSFKKSQDFNKLRIC